MLVVVKNDKTRSLTAVEVQALELGAVASHCDRAVATMCVRKGNRISTTCFVSLRKHVRRHSDVSSTTCFDHVQPFPPRTTITIAVTDLGGGPGGRGGPTPGGRGSPPGGGGPGGPRGGPPGGGGPGGPGGGDGGGGPGIRTTCRPGGPEERIRTVSIKRQPYNCSTRSRIHVHVTL